MYVGENVHNFGRMFFKSQLRKKVRLLEDVGKEGSTESMYVGENVHNFGRMFFKSQLRKKSKAFGRCRYGGKYREHVCRRKCAELW
jgi:predicted secreted acid phosphatase